MKTVLVTGGAGFIGSHLCERLVKDGHKVISLDNYFTGTKANHVGGVDYREGHTKDIAKLISETPDLVYHLGEYSRTAVAIDEPAVVLDLNMTGTAAVLEFCRQKNKLGKSKLVYAGSSTKFADMREDGVAGRDLSPYTWSKAANTELVRNYHAWYGMPYAIAYFYNVYGPRELSGKYGTVVEIYRQNILHNEPLKVNAPGTQTRTYTHVEDTVNALILIGEQGEGDEFGIASKDTYATRAVAELFQSDVVMMPARKTSRPSSPVDTQKTIALGWKQEHTLAEYVRSFKESAK
jgi:UDP-glucose 4-epimerase